MSCRGDCVSHHRLPSRRSFVTGIASAAAVPALARAQAGAPASAEDVRFMRVAIEEARQADFPFGAVIVRDGAVLARAGNRTLRDRDPTAHAEILALRQAAETIGTERLVDCDLYVTLEPCTMCAGAISFARIRRLYYGARDPKGGAVDSGVRFFASPTCHHAPDVYSAVGETEAAALLREFFRARR